MLKTFFFIIDDPYAYLSAKTGMTITPDEEEEEEVKLEGWDLMETDYH